MPEKFPEPNSLESMEGLHQYKQSFDVAPTTDLTLARIKEADQLDAVRAALIPEVPPEPLNNQDRATEKLKESLDFAWRHLLTEPYSVRSQQWAKDQLERALAQLAYKVGESSAQLFLGQVKDKYASELGKEPKINYSGNWDAFKDKTLG